VYKKQVKKMPFYNRLLLIVIHLMSYYIFFCIEGVRMYVKIQ